MDLHVGASQLLCFALNLLILRFGETVSLQETALENRRHPVMSCVVFVTYMLVTEANSYHRSRFRFQDVKRDSVWTSEKVDTSGTNIIRDALK